MSGTIDLLVDDGRSVSLSAGDVVVQRGTMHGWLNHGPEACEIAFILVSASPVIIDGLAMRDEGW